MSNIRWPWVRRSRLDTAKAIIGGLLLENDRLEATQKPADAPTATIPAHPRKGKPSKQRVKLSRMPKKTAKYR